MATASDDRTESDREIGLARRTYRTVTPPYRGREDREMSAIGWALFLGMVVILLPLLPVLVLVWLVTKLLGRGL